jgi:hypothetical protein
VLGTALKGRKEYPNKNKSKEKHSCFKCGKSGHFIAQCPNNDNDQAQEKKGKKERKKNYRNVKGEAHISKEWDSDCSSSDSDDEGLAASAFDKSSLFPNEHRTCLMAKEKKVRHEADCCSHDLLGTPDSPMAHRTVRCGLVTVGAGHASPADCAADRWRGWLTGQSSAHRTVR